MGPPVIGWITVCLLLQESEGRLRQKVGLRQHRGTGLDQDVVAGELRALRRDVHIFDAAHGSGQVLTQDGELLVGELQALNVATNLRAVR